MKLQLGTILFAFVVVFALLSTGPSSPAAELPPIQSRISHLMADMKSIEQVVVMFAFGGGSIESLKAIRVDLEKAQGKAEFPKFALHDNVLEVNGKATPIRLLSADPVRISFRGNIWTYKKDQSLEINYSSLRQILNEKRASLFGIESAYADDTPDQAAARERLSWELPIIAFAGVTICIFAEPCGVYVGTPFVANGIAYSAAHALNQAEGPVRAKVNCYPKAIPQYIEISSRIGRIRLQQDGSRYKTLVPGPGGRGHTEAWVEGKAAVKGSEAELDYLAKLIGQDPIECIKVEKKINDNLKAAFYSGKDNGPLDATEHEQNSTTVK